ncbi:saccharopine dehydrogenase [Leptolyngbya sp. Heron Island J]|uniref:saccharopine dehydrogenase family protein n=1 Tax=Leptolyngbya sp. Heron Island J TaxID=1385935 RepID=UPI0003B962C3|nr:saccharopine dehydrogenase NADP-binding domain-containing protein [Leptolyngbya sp. Heron Island J]ESA36655.1 saccharopine dehydrogenase [Leptolyngbya sp. Heron Island J]
MSKTRTIGVIGAYGQTGVVVVSELLKRTDCTLLIGGRDTQKVHHLVQVMGERVTGKVIDIDDRETLSEFCASCAIVVNCAGPSYAILDKVAQVAKEYNCHYVDPGGYEYVLEQLQPDQTEIVDKKLSFLLSAGWMPGLLEIFPMYVEACAVQYFDELNSLDIYYGDPSAWSIAGALDQVDFIQRYSHKSTGIFSHGEWQPKSFLSAAPTVALPKPLGKQRVFLQAFPEIKQFAAQRDFYQRIGSYVGLVSTNTILTSLYIKLFMKNRPLLAARRLQAAYKNDFERSQRIGGFIIAMIDGTKDRQSQQVIGTLFEKMHYWITGLVPAIAVEMLLKDQITKRGCHYLHEVVDPHYFMSELFKAGVQYDIQTSATASPKVSAV